MGPCHVSRFPFRAIAISGFTATYISYHPRNTLFRSYVITRLLPLPIMAAAFNIKRPRTPSTSSSSPSTSPAQAPPKAARLAPGESFSSVVEAIPHHPLICTLPPTCDRKPTPIANTNELESHYAHYHAHVCAVKGCRCVFPEERLLVLVCTMSLSNGWDLSAPISIKRNVTTQ